MTALIIDTAGKEAFLAKAHEGLMSSHLILPNPRQLSKILLPSIQSLLGSDIPTYIAVGTGPGTFTGTRVGAITALSLAFGWKIPCFPFSSTLLPDLESIASLSYQQFLSKTPPSHLELAYISPNP